MKMINSLKDSLYVVLVSVLFFHNASSHASDPFNADTLKRRATLIYEDKLRKNLSTLFKNENYLLSVTTEINKSKVDYELKQQKRLLNRNNIQLPDIPVDFTSEDYSRIVQDSLTDEGVLNFVSKINVQLVVKKGTSTEIISILKDTITKIIDSSDAQTGTVAIEPILATETDSWVKTLSAHQNLLAIIFLGICIFSGLLLTSKKVSSNNEQPTANLTASAPQGMPTYPSTMPMNIPPPALPTNHPAATHTRRRQEQIQHIAQKTPNHVAAVLRDYMHDTTNRRGVAALIRDLPLDTAKAVISHFSAKEASSIVSELTHTDELDAKMATKLSNSILAHELALTSSGWDFLSQLPDENLSRLLTTEDINTKSMILFHLPYGRASKFYSNLKEEEKSSIVAALFELENREDREFTNIRDRLKASTKQELGKPDAAIADASNWVLSVGQKLTERDRSALIAGTAVRSQPHFRAALFRFSDTEFLPEDVLQLVLSTFQPAELALLCASLDPASKLLSHILKTLPKQVREIVTDESNAQRSNLARPGRGHRIAEQIQILRNKFEETVKNMDSKGDISLESYFTTGSQILDAQNQLQIKTTNSAPGTIKIDSVDDDDKKMAA